MTTLFLTVGLPGAGKTTLARHLAAEHRALRLTPDAWMLPLFGAPETNGRRDVLEGRFLALALDAVRLGTNVILDFGCWTRDERTAIRSLTRAEGLEEPDRAETDGRTPDDPPAGSGSWREWAEVRRPGLAQT
ncbi:AAA family ATPase [Streptomyces sp. NPDC087440]|uniref:AAA family ATPase n=1 Tax=Streptomyces sp. NPDC087440 TaxID=3365790 RepID=UPI003809416C